MAVTKSGYCAVRFNGECEWLDMNSYAHSPTGCERDIENTRKFVPLWDEDNPVVRIVAVTVTEVDETKLFQRGSVINALRK